MKLTDKERRIYWKGFEVGKQNSLKHNIILMKGQLKASKEETKQQNREK